MIKVFIDGSAGTTGLRIKDRLQSRNDIELILLEEKYRKDTEARKEALNKADIAFLCLPDAAAISAVELIENNNTVVIDTSTAHRTAEGWSYGFAEIGDRYSEIAASKRIANPGCHASGFIALVEPLVKSGVIDKKAELSCVSVTGYSGGGKGMIAEYEEGMHTKNLVSPRMYGIGQQHKHLKEMVAISGIEVAPVFCPIVAPFYSGMEVTVPLFTKNIGCSKDEVIDIYRRYYNKGLVRVRSEADESGFMAANLLSGYDDMEITVVGNEERIVLVARYDNLGKGASGAAIQNMNIVIGAKESCGLNISERGNG